MTENEVVRLTTEEQTVGVKTQMLALLLRERRDEMIVKWHVHIQRWVCESPINECRANTELISFGLCCTALHFSEHTV